MLRILRILEIAFRFTQVRIVFLALSRSVKLIFHVVLLTIVLNYFFSLIALYLMQFGLNKTLNENMNKINSLFGTGLYKEKKRNFHIFCFSNLFKYLEHLLQFFVYLRKMNGLK